MMILHSCMWTFNILLLLTVKFTEGGVILLPSGQALVCHGEQFQLTCNATKSYYYLRWSFSVYNEQGVLTNYTRTVSSIDASQQNSQIVVNSTSFEFLRISNQGVPPITTMTINLVGNSLNGVTVGCTGLGNFEMRTARTSISIINESYQEQHQVYSRAQFGMDHAILTLELAANHGNHETGVSYNISVVPQVELVFTDSAIIQLRVAYSVVYNVNITRTLCGQYTTTTTLELSYARCGYPLAADNSLRITGYHSPGATITFSCPPGKTLVGPNTTTCKENGEWEPDPQIEGVKCAANYDLPLILINEDGKVYLENTTIDGASVLFICSNYVQHSFEQVHAAVCNPDGLGWPPNSTNLYSDGKSTGTCDGLIPALVSSTTVFTIISIIASVLIGFVCGRLAPGRNPRPTECLECRDNNISICSHHQSSHASTGHVYEAITSEMIENHFSDQEPHKVDLTENVAYEFVQPNIPKFVETP